jgi:hypothetical protein
MPYQGYGRRGHERVWWGLAVMILVILLALSWAWRG